MSSPTLRARRAAYGLALAVAVFLLVRLLQGARLDEPWAGQRLPWDLQVLRHTAGGAETLGILALVLGMAVVALGMRRLLAGGEAPVSAGEVLFFAASTADAVGGTVLHLLDPESAARGAALLVPARALVLAAAFPLMFLHLRRPGLCLLPAAVVLTLLGAALFHARVPAVPYQPPWRSGRAVDLVEAACPLYDLAEYRNGTVESRRSARQAYLGILKELVSMGRPGAEAVLYDRGGNVGWASHVLPEFGDDCQPVFLAALRSRFATARRGALSALEHRADRTEVARALVPLLSDPEPGVRQETARILGHVGHDREKHPPPARVEEAVVPLRRLLWDVDADTRETAVAALRYQAPRAAVADLAKLLRFEKNAKVCGEAWQTLALAATPDAIRAIAETYRREKGGWGNLHLDVQVPALPEPAVSVLIDLLETVHAENAWSVLQAVEFSPGMRLPRRAMDWLLAVACDADPKRRQTALRVVSHLDDPAAVEMCRAAMATGDAPWVVEGLRRCDRLDGPALLAAFDRQPREVLAWRHVGPRDAELADGLERRILDPENTTMRVTCALNWLKAIDRDRAAKTAQAVLDRTGPVDAPAWVVHALPSTAIPGLLEASCPRTREAALSRLGREHGPSVGERLAELIRSAPSAKVCSPVIQAAGRTRSRPAAPAICERLSKADFPVRAHSQEEWSILERVSILGEIGDPGSVGLLRDILRRAQVANLPRLAQAAAIALVATGDRSHVEALRDVIRWPEPSQSCACGDRTACSAARALASAGDAGLEVLLDLVQDPDVRVSVAEALGRTRSPRARAPLVALLRHAKADVRRAAALGLGHLADPGTTSALEAVGTDPCPTVREAARWAVQETTGVPAGLRLCERQPHRLEATAAASR